MSLAERAEGRKRTSDRKARPKVIYC